MRAFLVWLCLLGFLWGLTALAAPKTGDVEKAAKLYEEAEANYKLQKFKEALAGFEEAYRLTSEPSLLYNLGQCYRQLDRLEEAKKAYTSFVRDAPESPFRKSAEERIEEINAELLRRAQKGAIQISTQQEPTNVLLDGQPKGSSPILLQNIEPGEHHITIQKEGFVDFEVKILVKPSETSSLTVPKLLPFGETQANPGKLYYLGGAGLGGLGVLSAGGALAFLTVGRLKQNDLQVEDSNNNGIIDPDDTAQEESDIESNVKSAISFGAVSAGLLVGAAVSTIIGVTRQKKAQSAQKEQP